MAMQLHDITWHYMNYMPLHAEQDARVGLIFYIEDHDHVLTLNIGYNMTGYYIGYCQWHLLQSRGPLFPGFHTMPATKSLGTTCPGFLHPLFVQLLQRALTRKVPSMAPHPHVDFEQPAPSPTVWSRICCNFLWDLIPDAVRNCKDWVAVQVTRNQRHSATKDVCSAQFQISNIG
jgi:hypothetical protein